jgi:FkbM family methyltransferase
MNLVFEIIRALIPQSLIKKLKIKYNVPDMEWSIRNLYNNGFRPNTILDIGAFEGEWTLMCGSIFSDAKFIMFEAQESKKEKLELLKSNTIDYHIGLLGSELNEKSKFYVNETVSSALPETAKDHQEYIEIPMYTVDEVLKRKDIIKADFIKLDVQGFELEVLKGASKTLESAEVVLMEVSLIEINKGAPLINDVMQFMISKGFVCYDICSIVRRPLDKAMWQTDLIFVNKSSSLVASKKYQ